MTRKQDVRTSEDLQIYLQECADQAERLYHFTTLESLLCIIKGQNFRLSRMDLMNDKAEKVLGISAERSEKYIMSFTREKEYVSMWAMYGKPSGIKLRLDFDRKVFQKVINGNFYFDADKTKKIPIFGSTGKHVFSKTGWLLSDVVYLNKKTHEFRHNENPFKGIIANDHIISEVAGFVKYDAWEFERENRLRVNLHVQSNNEKESPNHIFAGIDPNLIRTFHITYNPWLSEELKKFVKECLGRAAGFEIPCENSTNDGEIDEI